MKFYKDIRRGTSIRSDLALASVRSWLGIALIIKGVFFLANRGELANLIDETGTMWFAPAALTHYVILAHLVGGFLLIVGFFTRFAALIQIPILLGAVFWIHLPRMVSLNLRNELGYSVFLLLLVLAVSALGAGRWSVDHYLSKQPGDVTHSTGTATTA